MAALWLRFRAELRTRWRAWAGFAVLAGLVGGVVLSLAAGARRTDSAYRRFLATQNASDVTVLNEVAGIEPGPSGVATFNADELRRLPTVAHVTATRHFYAILGAGFGVFVPPDDRVGGEVNRFKMLEGRRPDPRNPSEVAVSFTLAEELGVEVGDEITLVPRQFVGELLRDLRPEVAAQAADAARRVYSVLPAGKVTVVGIEASPGEFPPQIEGGFRLLIHASPALFPLRDDLSRITGGGESLLVQLRRGTRDTDAFLADLRRLGGGDLPNLIVQRDNTTAVERSVHTQALSLWLLALLTAVTGALVFGQLLARLAVLESDDGVVLGALGMSRWQRTALGVARAAMIGLGGSIVAVVVAALASPLFPFGLAATAEPDPGLRFDALVLGLGAAGVIATVVVLSWWPAWRSARVRSAVGAEIRPAGADAEAGASQVPRLVSSRRLPVPVSIGVRMALQPGGARRGAPVRNSVVAIVVGIVALVAALTFGSSLGHLLTTPSLYGHNWDAELTTYGPDLAAIGLPALEADPRVVGLAVGVTRAPLAVDGRRVDALILDTVRGDVAPTILDGRPPQAPDEVALGARTMRSLGADLGDTVAVGVFAAEVKPVPMRVVGRAVFPVFSEAGRLGDGAFVSQAGGERLARAPLGESALARFGPNVLVRLAPGASFDQVVADLNAHFGQGTFGVAVIRQGKPSDIVNFGRVEATPYVLGVIFGVLATATLTHVLVSSVRRRRRDLAVLKALGFDKGQVRRTVAWHATTLIVVALAVGVPLGVVAGRRLWTLFADNLGVAVVPRVPALALVAVVAAAVLVANLVAVVPASLAARTRPAEALRAE